MIMKPITVLVVDDSKDNLFLIRNFLVKAGAFVAEARSVAEALSRFQNQRPDVILTDIEMPDEDGYELLRKVRELAPTGKDVPPIAALTAHSGGEELRKILLSGFDTYLSKPISIEKLIASVHDLVSNKASH